MGLCFDGQAGGFDRRTGLPPQVCARVAEALVELGRAGTGDLVLEIGAGTGQIGIRLPRRLRYLGLDLSAGMLGVFSKRLPKGREGCLVRADANRGWPVAPSSVRILFGSRVFHLLDAGHLMGEALRVARTDGAALLIGRIKRHPHSLQARIQKEMRRLLQQDGWPGRSRHAAQQILAEHASRQGVLPIEPYTAARWTVTATPRQSIESWQSKQGLAGVCPPAGVKKKVLHQLSVWAQQEFGGLDNPSQNEQTYLLEGFRLPDPDPPRHTKAH